jgi:hypothetical protein
MPCVVEFKDGTTETFDSFTDAINAEGAQWGKVTISPQKGGE